MRRRPIAACFLVFLETVSAQIGLSSISGTVSDPRGTALAEAPIQVRNKATGTLARTLSKNDGRYSFANLSAGSYEISIVMPCCAYNRFRADVTIEAGQSAQLNA